MTRRVLLLAPFLSCVASSASAQSPVAEFSGTPTSGTVPLTVSFTDLSTTSDPTGIFAWEWDFDGDGTIDSTAQHPMHTYTTPGTYSVSLTVRDLLGNDTETKPGYVRADPPLVPDFTFTPQSGPVGTVVAFTDTSTGNPTMWDWDFGDNSGSGVQHPTHPYNATGTYQVRLRVAKGGPWTAWTPTKTLSIYGSSTNTKGPGLFRFPFDEPRGPLVANVSGNAALPSHGVVASANWQADPATVGDPRANWKANEPGFGCLGAATTPGAHRITTGWPLVAPSSFTVGWWQRRVGSLPHVETHAFGGFGGTVHALSGGTAGNGIVYRGSPIGDFGTVSDLRTPTTWKHVVLVVDDLLGRASWYVDGVLDAQTTFTPGLHAATNGGLNVGWHQTPANAWDGLFQMDDFLMDLRPWDALEIQALLQGELAAHMTFDGGCPGNVGTPQIGGTQSPTLGAAFAIEITNAEPNSIALLVLGIHVASGGFPLDLSPWTGVPCTVGVSPLLYVPVPTSPAGSATIALPIPNAMALAHTHTYAQGFVVAPGANLADLSTTPVLDVLVNDC